MLIDTHAHIHFSEFKDTLPQTFTNAKAANVTSIITVGTDDQDSLCALNFVLNPDVVGMASDIKLYATAGIHPHDASVGEDAFLSIKEMCQNQDYQKVLVAIGECGLDYFKNFSTKKEQQRMLHWQLQLAEECDLPVVFHIRDAWDDFFAILKDHPHIRGVIHSFTGYPEHVDMAGAYQLYFGINGIMTFTKDQAQLDAMKVIPEDRLLLETDCPFLAPVPHRGKQNEPAYLRDIADFVATYREEPVLEIKSQTTKNATELFGI